MLRIKIHLAFYDRQICGEIPVSTICTQERVAFTNLVNCSHFHKKPTRIERQAISGLLQLNASKCSTSLYLGRKNWLEIWCENSALEHLFILLFRIRLQGIASKESADHLPFNLCCLLYRNERNWPDWWTLWFPECSLPWLISSGSSTTRQQ